MTPAELLDLDLVTWPGRVFAFVWGAVWGSFLNVVIHRLPRQQSLVRPASRCPGCETPIAWYDNVPLLSWLLLRARCRHCRTAISARYPLVELLAALLSLALFEVHVAGGPPEVEVVVRLVPWLVSFTFVAALVAVTFIDLDVQLVPLAITWPGAALGVLLSFLLPEPGVWASLAGAVVGGGSLWLIDAVYRRVRGHPGMGGGDVSLLAMIGAFCGVRSLLFIVLAASLQGTLAAVVLGVLRRFGVRGGLKAPEGLDDPEAEARWEPLQEAGDDVPVHRTALAFVPFLSLAAVEWLLVGERLVRWYWSWLGGLLTFGGGG